MRKSLNREQGRRGAGAQGRILPHQPLKSLLPYLIALVSGILMGLTVAPVGAWFLAWVALSPLWVLVVESAKQNHTLPLLPKPPLLLYALAWGIGYHGVAISWITGVHPMTWMGVPWLASLAIALFCWIFITLWGAALVATWATCMAFIIRGLGIPARILIGIALWCSLEAVWSSGALWWTSLSYTQSPHNLAILHLGQLSGTSTVTASIVAINALIAEAWINRQQHKASPLTSSAFSAPLRYSSRSRFHVYVLHNRYLGIAASLFVTLHLIGSGLYTQPLIAPSANALKVGIIQGNIPNEIKLYPAGFRRAIEGYTTGYESLASQGIDAVLTPEGALPFVWSNVVNTSFYSAVQEKKVVAWVGAFGEQGQSITNSLFTLTDTGEVFSRYNKVKLVPLGEYIPFEQFLGSLVDRLSPLEAHQVAGSPKQVFDTPFGKAIVGICYDSAFSQHFRRQAHLGGQFILSASNNAHYSAAMPAQHHAQDVMRAIETDRWAVRATNTGYSGIIDPHGRTEWISRLNTYQLHAATIYRRQTQTLYVRWGDWLTPLLLVLGSITWYLGKQAGVGH